MCQAAAVGITLLRRTHDRPQLFMSSPPAGHHLTRQTLTLTAHQAAQHRHCTVVASKKVPPWLLKQALLAWSTGQHSVMWRNSSTEGPRGAPPDTTKRTRPPKAALVFLKTTRSIRGDACRGAAL